MAEICEVDELASMLRDNLRVKHLVLSVEEKLVEFLQAPFTGKLMLLELEPMASYQRMLLHRLADIFGLKHESVGEGDERHLVIQRDRESAIPSVLPSHVLQTTYGESPQATSTRQLLRRDSGQDGTTREAEAEGAEEDLVVCFSAHERPVPRPVNRAVSMAAKRMIARALG